jgi:hypothetical protein
VRVSEGARHLLASAAVVLLAPMTMAAASIEGSPLRDAIRGPFERLGIVSPESVRDGTAPAGAPAPAGPGAATGGQADEADPGTTTPGGEVQTATPAESDNDSMETPPAEPVPPPADEVTPAEAPPEPSPDPAVPPGEGDVVAPDGPEGDGPVLGEEPLDDLIGLAPELGAEMP